MNSHLSFLDAAKILKDRKSYQSKTFKLISSFNTAQLEFYIKAYAKIQSLDIKIETIPFGTLRQNVISNNDDKDSILLLTPADFSPALDWRTGFPEKSMSIETVFNEISLFKKLIKDSSFKEIFFLPIPLPPLFGESNTDLSIELNIKNVASELGALILNDSYFSLDTYLISGCAISGSCLSAAAHVISNKIFLKRVEKKKIIVTDLDNTLWNGVLGEDGLDGIQASSEGSGFHYFIYQTYLKKLKEAGTLLSVCSKNDEDLVKKAFDNNNFILGLNDFVSIQASYNPKSLQIKELAKTLNLGLEAFVFIDDNPVEISEVQSSLPGVECILFSLESSAYIDMFQHLSSMLYNNNPTEEDKNRTKLYRSMKQTVDVIEGESSDLTPFLKSLEMKVTLSKKNTIHDGDRAIQLINKTNQFNLNGLRRSSEEVRAVMENGGHLFTASLSDINGEHGEILSLLIDNNNEVQSFVMSCRVFQRKVEFLFLSMLLKKYFDEIKFHFIQTERNSPVKLFFNTFKNIDISKEIILSTKDIDVTEQNLYQIFSMENIIING